MLGACGREGQFLECYLPNPTSQLGPPQAPLPAPVTLTGISPHPPLSGKLDDLSEPETQTGKHFLNRKVLCKDGGSRIAPRSQQSPQLATGAGKAQASGLQGAPHPSPPPVPQASCTTRCCCGIRNGQLTGGKEGGERRGFALPVAHLASFCIS